MTPEHRIKILHEIRDTYPGHSADAQRQRVLAILSRMSVTTYQLMRFADVFDPRPRVFELRAQGYDIRTSRVLAETESGELHRLGMYSLWGKGGANA